MSNPFCYVEFHTREPDRFNAFYGQLFAWHIEEIVSGNWSVDTGTFPVGGMRQAAPDMPTEILIYTQVDDIHQTIARAQALGARQIQPKTAFLLFRPVAAIASLGEDRPDVSREIDWNIGGRFRGPRRDAECHQEPNSQCDSPVDRSCLHGTQLYDAGRVSVYRRLSTDSGETAGFGWPC